MNAFIDAMQLTLNLTSTLTSPKRKYFVINNVFLLSLLIKATVLVKK